MEKVLVKKAKENSRANRSNDMDYFAAYYKEKFPGQQFVVFKKSGGHPTRILELLEDIITRKKLSKFIDNYR